MKRRLTAFNFLSTQCNPIRTGQDFDNLYLDVNAVLQPCAHPEGEEPPLAKGATMIESFEYTKRFVKMVCYKDKRN